MARYRRPARCRLCGFPASDGAVLVSELDLDKLSRWCLRTMDAEFDPSKAAEAVFCRFCVAEARLEADQSGMQRAERNKINWWNTGQLMDVTWNYFFLGGQIRPCAVKINTLCDRILKKYNVHIEETKHHVRSSVPRRTRSVQNCVGCSEKFHSKISLQQHIESSHKSVEEQKASGLEDFVGGKKCLYCDLKVDSQSIHRHVRTHHPKEASLRCTAPQCGRYFHTEEDKLVHFQREHQFPCKECPESFTSKSCLRRHIKTFHRSPTDLPSTEEKPARGLMKTKEEQGKGLSKVVKCPTCFKMVSKSMWTRHKRYQHNGGRLEKCIYCPFVSKTYPIANHIRITHKSVAIKCRKYCATFFLTTEERDKHEQVYHAPKSLVGNLASDQLNSANSGKAPKKRTMASSSGEKGQVLCSFCTVKVKHRDMATHLTEKHGLEVIKCTMKRCPAYFMTEEERDQHFSQLHIKARNNVQCFFCVKKFSNKYSLISHVKKEHKDMTILNCVVTRCSAFFSSVADREDHMTKEHAQYKTANLIKCSKCDFQTTQVSYLNMHNNRHHSILSIKCPQCPKRFTSEEVLKFHKKYVHEIGKAKCTYCKKLLFCLSSHQKKVVCTICGHVALCLASHRYHKMSCK